MKHKLINIVTKIVAPACLLLFWLYATVQYVKSPQVGITSINTVVPNANLNGPLGQTLLTGNKITALFRSRFDNLGSVSIRFHNSDQDSKDQILFKIKEASDAKWYYQAKYNTDQFQPHDLFPFGFPSISSSHGKTYFVEIESLNGSTLSGVYVDLQSPIMTVRSSFPASKLFQDKKLLIYYVIHKTINLLTDLNFITVILSSLLPFIIYRILLNYLGPSLRLITLYLLFIAVFDSIYFRNYTEILISVVILFWIISVYQCRIRSNISLLFSIIILMIAPIFFLLGKTNVSDKLSSWFAIFLILGICQSVYEIRKPKWAKLDLKQYIHGFFPNNVDISYSLLSAIKKETNKTITFYNNNKYYLKLLGVFVLISLEISLISHIIRTFRSNLYFYRDFFFSHQTDRFIAEIGIPVAAVGLITITITALFIIRLRRVWLLLIASTLLIIYFQNTIFKVNTSKLSETILIWSIFPPRSTLWDEVHIYGQNFGNLPYMGTVRIGGNEHRVIKWTNKHIVIQAEPGKSKSGNLIVIDRYGKQSVPINFVYYDFFTKEIVK